MPAIDPVRPRQGRTGPGCERLRPVIKLPHFGADVVSTILAAFLDGEACPERIGGLIYPARAQSLWLESTKSAVLLFVNGFSQTGRTQDRSISTPTDRCSNGTETTSRNFLSTFTTRPSKPASGPASMKTRLPTVKRVQGSAGRPD